MNAFYEHHQNSIRFGYRCLIGFCSTASSNLSSNPSESWVSSAQGKESCLCLPLTAHETADLT
jgi:hypothetical protein